MLSALHIQDFVLIKQARLIFDRGLTALTGETGAGKSILLDALGFAVGGRSARGAVRQGAKQGSVSASFEVTANHGVWALMEENGLPISEDEIILRRMQNPDGRSRAFINDHPVSIGLLRLIGGRLLEIHGQHDGRGLLEAQGHRQLLDEFGGLQKRADDVVKKWARISTLQSTLEEKKRERDAHANEAAYLRHVVERLEEINPQADEESALALRRAELMAAEKLSADLSEIENLFDENTVGRLVSNALTLMERAGDRLEKPPASLIEASTYLESTLNDWESAGQAIAVVVRQFGGDASELESVEERLFLLRGEARKLGVAPDGLSAFLKKSQEALHNVSAGENAFIELEQELVEAREAYLKSATDLSKRRHEAGTKLDRAIQKELKPLKLDKATFTTRIETSADTPMSTGIDSVEFMVATNPGAPAGPLRVIASGGELSRFILAMKAALAMKEDRTVIIFDEVDAGVGGAVADAVGDRLARLASDAQVLVVTHSPQVCARAHAHWRVEKKVSSGTTLTTLGKLDDDGRLEEVARMLSGAAITDEARAAAAKLLNAPAPKPPRTRKKLAKAS